jgi:hypothetical protein
MFYFHSIAFCITLRGPSLESDKYMGCLRIAWLTGWCFDNLVSALVIPRMHVLKSSDKSGLRVDWEDGGWARSCV